MRRTSILLTVTLALLATACGGEDTTTDTAGTTDTVVEDVVDGDDDPVDTTDTSGTSGTAGTIDADACTRAAEALTAVPAAIGTALTGSADLAAVASDAESVADLADSVPEQYADDFRVIADTYTEITTTLDGVSIEPGAIPDAQTQAALSELSSTLADGAFTTAATNVSAYFQAGCPSS